jgi:peptide deformylase
MSELPDGGAVRPMTRWGEPVMHAPCAPVADFDAGLRTLVADMVATMRAADGVGLAANQVGVSLRVFVFDCPDKDDVIHRGVVCNPVLTLPEGADRVLEEADEGCLSLPGAFALSARPDFARVDGQDEHGRPVAYEGTGVLARCLQHETDHLNGTVFGDRLPQKLRKRLFKDAEKIADEFPPGWPAGSSVEA